MATRRDVFDELEYADFIGAADSHRGELRGPVSGQEVWAARGVVSLTMSCDGAVTEDGMGFSKSDTNAGRYLGHFIGSGGKLDDEEWSSAIGLLRKYHGQIGACPMPDDDDFAREQRLMSVRAPIVAFRDRLAAVLREAKREQKRRDDEREEAERKIRQPDVTIERQGADKDGKGGVWVVRTPYNAPAVDAWRDLHNKHGGEWDSLRRVRRVPHKAARAVDALLREHHAGQYARGPKGVFIIPAPGEEGAIIAGTEPGARDAAPVAAPVPAAPIAAAVPVTFASEADRVAAVDAIIANPNCRASDLGRAMAILGSELSDEELADLEAGLRDL